MTLDAIYDNVQVPNGLSEFSDWSRVHLRIQKRNGRQNITTITGLAPDLDEKRILKALKKKFSCNGSMKFEKDKNGNERFVALQLTGDQRDNVKEFLINEEICTEEQIIKHGH